MQVNEHALKKLVYWIEERYAIFKRKEANEPKPWTTDPILKEYRFCNVHRENDKVTRWIADNWRDPNTNDPDVWFAMFVARHINWPDTMALLDYPVPWEGGDRLIALAREVKQQGRKLMGGAYMITTHGGLGTIEHFLAELFDVAWARRDFLRPRLAEPLKEFFERLTSLEHIGNFLAGQVIADTKYTLLLEHSPDWWTWACSGPGSMRGLNRLYGKPVKRVETNEEKWYHEFLYAYELVKERTFIDLHAQDFQNCLCEFDKYMRVFLGEGKPRSRYNGV
jgi:hypothetical protein